MINTIIFNLSWDSKLTAIPCGFWIRDRWEGNSPPTQSSWSESTYKLTRSKKYSGSLKALQAQPPS